MPLRARLYISAMSLAGLAAAAYTFHAARIEISPRFLLYLAIALASSGLKVRLPGLHGSISVNYVFTFLSLLEFNAPETMLLAQASVVLQTFWHAEDKPRPVHIVFNLANITITVAAAVLVYSQHWFEGVSEGQLLRLSLAGILYFLVNTMPIAVVIALTEVRSLKTTCREVFDWSFSYYLIGVCLAEMVHLSIERVGWTFTLALIPVLYMVYRSYKLYTGRLLQEKRHVESTAALHVRTIEALAMAIEAKDECTSEHLRRVQVYSLRVAEELGLSADEKQALHAASILHDIGKLAVPDYIIAKPGKLTPEEFEKMKVHTTVGSAILEQVGFPYAVAPIVRSHHERWDGSGYPDGIRGEQIPIGARILAAVDCLDALASDRQYRSALPLDEAMDYVSSLTGRSFDPKVVEVLQRQYREFEALASQSPRRKMLSAKDATVTRGDSPAAGFQSPTNSLPGSGESAQAFISSIASARHEVQTILELTQDLSGALRLHDILLLVSDRLKQLIPFDCIAFYVREEGILKPKYLNGDAKRSLSPAGIPLGQGLSGWVAQNSKPILNGNPAVEPGYLGDSQGFFRLRSALSVPFGGCSEQFVGAITLYHAELNAYNKEHLRILLAVNDKVSQAIERASKFEQAREEANTDELTKLPNARSLVLHMQNELARCESQNQRLAVIVCDLDGFKHVNDSLGHLTGNEVLKRVARILERNCRETDYVSRMGGDEFVVMIPGIRPEELEEKIEAMDQMVRKASAELCGGVEVGISVGVAYFPEHGTDVETLLSRADKEMYAAKERRKASIGKVVPLRRRGVR